MSLTESNPFFKFLIFIKKIRYFEVLSIYGVAAATFSSTKFLAWNLNNFCKTSAPR